MLCLCPSRLLADKIGGSLGFPVEVSGFGGFTTAIPEVPKLDKGCLGNTVVRHSNGKFYTALVKPDKIGSTYGKIGHSG
jgi:hypothetical protein